MPTPPPYPILYRKLITNPLMLTHIKRLMAETGETPHEIICRLLNEAFVKEVKRYLETGQTTPPEIE